MGEPLPRLLLEIYGQNYIEAQPCFLSMPLDKIKYFPWAGKKFQLPPLRHSDFSAETSPRKRFSVFYTPRDKNYVNVPFRTVRYIITYQSTQEHLYTFNVGVKLNIYEIKKVINFIVPQAGTLDFQGLTLIFPILDLDFTSYNSAFRPPSQHHRLRLTLSFSTRYRTSQSDK